MPTILAIVVSLASAGAASAQDRAAASPALRLEFSRPITVHFVDVRLSQALRDLGRVAGARVTLAPDVPDTLVSDTMFVNVAFEDAFATIVGGECLAYKITGPRSIVVMRSLSGGKSMAHGPRAIVAPDCTDGYVPPKPPEVSWEGFQRLSS